MTEENQKTEEEESVISKAESLAAKLEEQNKKYEELIQRQEALEASKTLHGRGITGAKQEQAKELSAAEYKEVVEKQLAEGEFD